MLTGIGRSGRRRVPLRYQLTGTECGAACLAMVLSYHGRDTSVSECRELLRPGRDGVSAPRLAEAAASYGLESRLDHRADPFAEPLAGPAIAYLTRHHFVVVERVGGHRLRISDPAAGRELQTRDEFSERYGGVLIRLTPGPGFRTRRVALLDGLVGRYLREFVATPGGRRLLAGIGAAVALLQALGLALPLATRFAVDRVIPQARQELLPVLAVGAVGTAVLYGLLALLRGRLLVMLRARADRQLTQRFVAHLLRLPLTYFMQRPRGDLLLRLASVSATREQLTQLALTLLLDAALLSGYLIGLAILAPQYVVVVCGLGVAQVAVLAVSYRRIRMLARHELRAKAEEQSQLVELLEAIAPVKANGVEPQAAARWQELFDRYRTAMVRRGRASAWVEAAQGALSTLAPLALLWFGLSLVLHGRLTLGTMLAANSIALSVLAPLSTFVGAIQIFSVLRAQVERIYDVLDTPAEAIGSLVLSPRDSVQLETSAVTFRYQAGGPAALSDITLTVPCGTKVAIVGQTGSGKSTLALLVLGLLRPDAGSISYDGVPIDQLNLAELRRSCGVVLQQLTLFNGSIRDNVTLGRSDFDDAEVAVAARTAGLQADLGRLPMGYDTMVGEGGSALSAGQRQRVALARALLHRPRLLILDEATSHLDPKTERQVDEALSRLRVTRIVISHRLSAVQNADLTLVLEAGRIVARGRHDDLMARGGIYREMFGAVTRGPHANGHMPSVQLQRRNT